MATPTFIIVVGLSGVGKTAFCNCLSKVSNFHTINSGDAIRNFLATEGIEVRNRIETGDVFLKNFSEYKLYQIIYDYAISKNANIIDGIRLKSTLNYFLSKNSKPVIIYIEASESVRHERFSNRLIQDNSSKEQAEQIISKKNSYFDEVVSLKKMADYTINNNVNTDLLEQAENIWSKVEKYICK